MIVQHRRSISYSLASSIGAQCALMLLFLTAAPAGAAIVWNGPTVSFSKLALADPTLPANQDRLTSDVWLARGNSSGLYNAVSETGFTDFSSPAGTEWSYGTLANYTSLTY